MYRRYSEPQLCQSTMYHRYKYQCLFRIGSLVMKLFKFPMRDNSKYIIGHSYTKISQTGTQFPMHPLKTICTTVENALAHNELKENQSEKEIIYLLTFFLISMLFQILKLYLWMIDFFF